MVTQYGKCTVAWRSQQQKCVAVSTAASESVKDILWLKRFLKEIDISPECVLYIDNQSAIKIIKNSEYHKRTKHIEVRFHFIREKFNDQEFFLQSELQLAAILTKPLARPKFEALRDFLIKSLNI